MLGFQHWYVYPAEGSRFQVTFEQAAVGMVHGDLHGGVLRVNRRACEMLRAVFVAYLAEPERLGEAAARRIEREGLHRTVCDYIAGMTDRYLLEEHARLGV